MRVAFQLFGHLRTFEQCALSFRRHLLDGYPDHDVFIHTWDRLDHESVTHHRFRAAPAPVDTAILNRINELYRPTRVQVDAQQPHDRGELAFASGARMSIDGIVHMLRSMRRANDLRVAHSADTGAAYDAVVALRPDLRFHRDLDLAGYFSYCRPPITPDDETATTRFCAFGPLPRVVNDLRGTPATDLLFFGTPDVMTRALTLEGELGRYDLHQVVAPNRPQNLLNTYSADIGLRVAVIDFVRPRDFDIVRPGDAPTP